jgi:putative endonuclease
LKAEITKLQKGRNAEDIAMEYLIVNGYEILATNWRSGKAEIDIIAKDFDHLVFIEVKSRSYDTLGKPENAVNAKKEQMIIRGATSYMDQHNYEGKIRFDVISIILRSEQDFDLEHFEDAFFPGLD